MVIGEQRGEGVRMGCRCFWDPDTDAYAEDTYRNVRALDQIPAPLATCLAPHQPNIRPVEPAPPPIDCRT